MRYGLLTDIHGNHAALRAAIDHLSRDGVDRWLCAGDIVGYGPQPNECVETIAELGALTVAGNHELFALGALDANGGGALCRATTPWTMRVLRPDVRDYLHTLPRLLDLGEVVMAHGSLTDPEQYVRSAAGSADQLRQLGECHPAATILVLGHTHLQWAYGRETRFAVDAPVHLGRADTFVVNPGAVGQSRAAEPVPRARCASVDLDRREVRFHAVGYDVTATRAALRRSGLPRECVHVHPGLAPTAVRRARRLTRALVARSEETAGE